MSDKQVASLPEFSSENSNLVTPVFSWVRVQAQLRFEMAATLASPRAVFTLWFGLEREVRAVVLVRQSLLGLFALWTYCASVHHVASGSLQHQNTCPGPADAM
jgi:hypothetical protein